MSILQFGAVLGVAWLMAHVVHIVVEDWWHRSTH